MRRKLFVFIIITIISVGLLAGSNTVYAFSPMDMAGKYMCYDSVPEMTLSISIYTTNIRHKKNIGTYTAAFPRCGIEYNGYVKRCKNKNKFKLVTKDKDYNDAYIKIVDSTYGQMKLRYMECNSKFDVIFEMFEKYEP